MAGTIHVDEESLSRLKTSLSTAGESYKRDLARLENLIQEITSGDIMGDPATDLLNKFETKRDVFNNLAKTIDEAEEYTGVQSTKFTNMIGDLSSGMK